ncbi:hypothetical protein H2202_002684 [Exophiala xenobiotica]|nr:hypothetical protein H2202_002684 [Exophiala xenobiotica]
MDGHRARHKSPPQHYGHHQALQQRQPSVPRFQPSQEIALQPLVERYVTNYNSGGDGHPRDLWMFPFLNGQSTWREKSLDLSIRAAAAAFSALEAQNPQLMQQSREIYGAAVSQHIHSLSGQISPRGVNPLNVATSLMLASFESLSTPATFRAYKSHLDGVSEMLLLSTDMIQQDDLLNQLFFEARAYTLFTSLLSGQKSIFSSDMFAQVRYVGRELPMLEDIIGITTDLINTWTDIRAGKSIGSGKLEQVQAIGERVEEGWEDYQAEAKSSKKPLMWKNESDQYDYRDTYTALTIAHFDATRILLELISQFPCTSFSGKRLVHDSSASIITVANFIDRRSTGCAYVRILFPLTLVALYGPAQQHKEAQILFRKWYTPIKVAGFSPMALDMISLHTMSMRHVSTQIS